MLDACYFFHFSLAIYAKRGMIFPAPKSGELPRINRIFSAVIYCAGYFQRATGLATRRLNSKYEIKETQNGKTT